MESAHLTAEQAGELGAAVGPARDYLARLCARMSELGFPEGDPLYASARRAMDAVEALLFAAERLEEGARERVDRPRWITARAIRSAPSASVILRRYGRSRRHPHPRCRRAGGPGRCAATAAIGL